MPSSTMGGFDVFIDNDDGTVTPIATPTVHVYDVTHSAALSDVVGDAAGHVASRTVAVAAGTVLRHYYTGATGLVGFQEGVTT